MVTVRHLPATLAARRAKLSEASFARSALISIVGPQLGAGVSVSAFSQARNKVITGIGLAAGVAATAALWNIGFVAWIAGALPVIIYTAQRKGADTFNSYKIRRSE
jgi:hypothetical protein